MILIIQSIESPDDRYFMEHIYMSYKRLMLSVILKITKDTWDAEDIMQSLVLKFIDKLPLLRTLSKPKLIHYIITSSRNAALNHLRSKSRNKNVPYGEEVEDIRRYTPNIDEGIIFREQLNGIVDAWGKLDERNKRLLELKYFLLKPDKEIASEFEIQVGSVRMALSRARSALKDLMDM